MRTMSKALVSLVVLGALGLPLHAADDDEDANAIRMSLKDCLATALENNLDLRTARLDPESALENVTFQKAAFDPLLGAQAAYNDSKTKYTTELNNGGPATTTDSDNSDSNLTANASLAQRLNFGADYTVRLNGRDGSSSGDTFDPSTGFFTRATQDPKSWGVGVTFNLPLLKGFGKEVNTEGILLAKNDLRISNEELRRRAEVTVKATEDAYWDIAAARAAYKVSKQSLKLAQDLYDLNKKKVEVGTLAPIEITQAEAGVASREEGVIVAENLVRNTEDNLRRLLAVPKDDPSWSRPIVPTEQPTQDPVTIDLDAAIATALSERAEVKNAHTSLESSDLSARVAKKNVRHRLDLQLSVDSNRFDQTSTTQILNAAIPPTAADINGKTEPNWTVGLLYAYPFGNRAAKSTAAIAEINKERATLGLESVEQDVRVDVRAAARAVESGAKRVAAAHANTVLQDKTVAAELKKFENGMSTSFEVLRIQNDLADAQVAEIRAMLDYNKALSDFERAKGTLLQAKGLTLAGDSQQH